MKNHSADLLLAVLTASALLSSRSFAGLPPPAWWNSVIPPGAPASDYGIVNAGQLRHFTVTAIDEIEARTAALLPAATRPALLAARTALAGATGDAFAPVNQGQVKRAVMPLIDRLAEVGYYRPGVYPWGVTGLPAASDYSAVNAGQLKHALYFDLTADGTATAPVFVSGVLQPALWPMPADTIPDWINARDSGMYFSDLTGHTLPDVAGRPVTAYYNARAATMATLGQAEAIRFLNQATFGACPAALAPATGTGVTAAGLNVSAWFASQKSLPATVLTRSSDFQGTVLAGTVTGSMEPIPQSAFPGMEQGWVTATDGKVWRPVVNGPVTTVEFLTRVSHPTLGGWWFRTDTTTSGNRILNNAVNGADQLRQRMAWALSQILVVSFADPDLFEWSKSNGIGAAVDRYYDLLLEEGLGNYRALLEKVTTSPVMGVYLDLNGSSESSPTATTDNTTANENYARELLQLFSLGTDRLAWDGSVASGRSYDPVADVRAVARALTGWQWKPANTTTQTDFYWPTQRPAIDDPMVPSELVNIITSYSPVTITNQGSKHVTPPSAEFVELDFPAGLATGRTTTQIDDMRRVLDSICDTGTAALGFSAGATAAEKRFKAGRNTAVFISRQLIQLLVTSNPPADYVSRVAQVFYENRHAPDQLYQVARAILLDPHARKLPCSSTDAYKRYGIVREPFLKMTHTIRALNGAPLSKPARTASGTGSGLIDGRSEHTDFALGTLAYNDDSAVVFGQSPLMAPSVFNFYRPDYRAPGLPSAPGTAMVSPAAQLLTSDRIYTSFNRFSDWVADRERFVVGYNRPRTGIVFLNPGPASASSEALRGNVVPADSAARMAQTSAILDYLALWMSGTLRDRTAIETELTDAFYDATLRPAPEVEHDAGWCFAVSAENPGSIHEIRLIDGEVRSVLSTGGGAVSGLACDRRNGILYFSEGQVLRALRLKDEGTNVLTVTGTGVAPFTQSDTVINGMDVFLPQQPVNQAPPNPLLCVLSTTSSGSAAGIWMRLFAVTPGTGSTPPSVGAAVFEKKLTFSSADNPPEGFEFLDVAAESWDGYGDFFLTGRDSSGCFGSVYRITGPVVVGSGRTPWADVSPEVVRLGGLSGMGPVTYGSDGGHLLYSAGAPSGGVAALNGISIQPATVSSSGSAPRTLAGAGPLTITDITEGANTGDLVPSAFAGGIYDRSKRSAAAAWLTLLSPEFAVQK